jgi:hypothetical protein
LMRRTNINTVNSPLSRLDFQRIQKLALFKIDSIYFVSAGSNV